MLGKKSGETGAEIAVRLRLQRESGAGHLPEPGLILGWGEQHEAAVSDGLVTLDAIAQESIGQRDGERFARLGGEARLHLPGQRRLGEKGEQSLVGNAHAWETERRRGFPSSYSSHKRFVQRLQAKKKKR
ncbi:MAG: hypothetical protein U0793_09060 [Gemmataceae bacterium]